MLKSPEIVVIIPTIRLDQWLDQAVNSILNQDGVTFRVVVAHDGVAPDPSLTWMKDTRVTALHSQERIGLAGGLNLAIASSSEQFIARLDADDIALPGRLATQLAYLKLHPQTVLVGTQAERIDEHGRVTGGIDSAVGPDVRYSLLERNRIIHPSVMFRRSAFIAAGGYDNRLRVMEDYDMWLRMAPLGPIAVLESRSISYRVHSSQMSRGAKPYGTHLTKILQSHRRLGRHLQINPFLVGAKAAAWTSAQYLRYWGLRKSRLDQ